MRLLLFFMSVTLAHAASIVGKVVGVSDGDTITILSGAREAIRVRLFGVDAPESGQAFGARAKQELSDLVFGKSVRVDVEEKDRYGRTVGRVFAGEMNVNVEMVRRGFAWWYQQYARKAVDLAAAEADAKNHKRGLWVDKTPMPPWDFRRNESKAKKAVTR